ncbi:hypothetical protein HH308_02180 [Gordonia sp. TBRC 11910]|uniref:Permease n=1 Tax=Gordonia asplenii TaxID=2725283 RepID=A0A848KX30_9ACTN|nr:hypothetical protein [Gordonia asplenii]
MDPTAFDKPRLDVDQPAPAKPEALGDKVNRLAKKGVVWLVFIGLAVITYFVLANLLPQWWAQRIAERVSGRFSTGIWVGFTLAFFCTLLPIVFLCLAFVNRAKLKYVPTIAFTVLAVVAAVPNLLTLSIVLGRTSGAYRGQFILDVNGPGFRGAGAWGAIIAAVVGALVCYYIWRFRRRGRALAKERAANAELRDPK